MNEGVMVHTASASKADGSWEVVGVEQGPLMMPMN